MIDDTVKSILSSFTLRKVYADSLPKNPNYPLIIFKISSSKDNVSLDASGVTDSFCRIEVDSRSKVRSEALSLADEINASLSGYRGTVNGVEVGLVRRENRVTIDDNAVDSVRVIQDYIMFY